MIDVLPLVLAISVWVPFWPTKYIYRDSIADGPEAHKLQARDDYPSVSA
jgi:hypothetical protein